MIKSIYKISLLLVGMLVISAPSGHAQTGNTIIENIRLELQRTDEIIDRAREMVRASKEPASALALEQAIALQKQAWDNFYKATLEGYTFAHRLTQQAREQAKQALSSARFSEQGQDAVLSKLERTEDLLRQAHEEMPSTVDESLRTIFDTARRNLGQAWEFYRNGQYRPSVKLANQVEKTAKRLLQIANRQHNFEANFQRRLEAVKQFIDRVEGEAKNCQSEPAQILIQNAKSALQTAVDLAAKGQYEQASRHLQQARKFATDAADLCGRAKEFGGAIDRLTNEAERLREQIRPGDENGMKLLEQVFGQIENAKDFIARQDSEAAAAALRAAQLTLKQLQRYLDTGE